MTETQPDPFAGIDPRLREAMLRRGFSELTAVQRAVLADDSGRDLRISSETGSGKTVALGLLLAPTLFEASNNKDQKGPRALVITPTRELANQVRDEVSWLYQGVPQARIASVTGGTDVQRERRLLNGRPSLLVGTPGRLLDHLRSGALDCTSTAHVVLDEADQMLDMGFREELEAIVERLPAERHSHLLSATFPDQVRRLADAFQKEPLRLEGTRHGEANTDIDHVVHLVHRDQRYAAIVNTLLLAQGERCLVFVQRRADATEVAGMLSSDGFSALPLSGELSQSERTRSLNAFREGSVRTLVATDVAARGIDVADISVVIQADLPKDAQAYTHRSGRTGRAGRQGKSTLLVTPQSARRVEFLLRDARVQAEWVTVPPPKKIRRAVTKATRRAFHERLAGEEGPAESQLEYARALLEEQEDPAKVVATLLEMAEPELPCKPHSVSAPARPAARPRTPHRGQGGPPQRGQAGPPHRGHSGGGGGPPQRRRQPTRKPSPTR